MPAIHRSALHPVPIEILKDAIRTARAQDIRVRIGDPGVVATSTHGSNPWELDPLGREPGVSPTGAVLLLCQPSPMSERDIALAISLNVHRAWIAGLEDGLAMQPRDSRWSQSSARAQYAHGFESGLLLRIHVLAGGY